MTPAIGAEIAGVDLGQPLDEQAFVEIHHALMAYQVIVFRDQAISEVDFIALARRFGKPQINDNSSFANLDGYPEIEVLDYDGSHPPYVTKEMWHTDFTGHELPTMGALLYALQSPEFGGDTIWISGYAAYETLSEKMKAYLLDMTAEHSTFKSFGDDIRSNLWSDEEGQSRLQKIRSRPPVVHPVIRTHPVTERKSLFVNEGYTTRLLGVDRQESDAILKYLFDHVRKPEFQVRLRWRKGSLAVWDNRVTQHYALADYTDRRHMHRIAICGDRPY